MKKEQILAGLLESIPKLSGGQLHWMGRVANAFNSKSRFTILTTDLFDKISLENFGDAMRVHHAFSAEPFSKDKFEYLLVNVLNQSGHKAKLAPKGNPGHDATFGDIRLSLKTQADHSIKDDRIWISKFMELGKGSWSNKPSDLEGLLKQFLVHLSSYDRILTLRAISKAPNWKYELVEIPKELLALSKSGKLEMRLESKQLPKPGYCYVRDPKENQLFELYFDGGGERKLQIRNLKKSLCRVHATWEFTALEME